MRHRLEKIQSRERHIDRGGKERERKEMDRERGRGEKAAHALVEVKSSEQRCSFFFRLSCSSLDVQNCL